MMQVLGWTYSSIKIHLLKSICVRGYTLTCSSEGQLDSTWWCRNNRCRTHRSSLQHNIQTMSFIENLYFRNYPSYVFAPINVILNKLVNICRVTCICFPLANRIHYKFSLSILYLIWA